MTEVPQDADQTENQSENHNADRKQINTIKQDKMFVYACRIRNGEAGGKYLYCLEDRKFYNYKTGFWITLDDVDFLGKIEESMHEITKFAIGRRKQIVDNFKQIGRKSIEQFNWSDLLNFKNGMLNPADGTLLDHHESFYSTNQIEYEYIENVKCDLWIKTLSEIFEQDERKIELLKEFFGYCLSPKTKLKKALLLMGDTDTGKSTVLEILQYMIGKDNFSNVELDNFDDPQFTPQMSNKLVNIDSDVDKNALNYERPFRKITSCESINTNQKWEKTKTIIPYCKIVLAANEFPVVKDRTSAFYNRLILIPFNRRFSEAEKNIELPDLLKKEIAGILNWSIEGLMLLKKRGKFKEFDFVKDAVKELEDDNNPVNGFFDEHIEIERGYEIEKSELYQKYVNWSEKTKVFTLNSIKFSNVLFKKYHKETSKDARRACNGPRVWRNIRYVDFKSDVVKTEVDWQSPPETVTPPTRQAM